MKKTTIIEIFAILFVILFLYTGISKLSEYSIFKEQIATSPIFAPFSNIVAHTIPWTEFFATILLIIPKWRYKGFIFSLILMILFTFYIIGILLFNKNLPCSCGGVLEQLSWSQHLIFNSVMILIASLGITFERQVKKIEKEELTLLKSRPFTI